MDKKFCIGLAEKIVAAKTMLNETQAARHAIALALQKQGLFVVCDETPACYRDPFHSLPLRHNKEYWNRQFSIGSEAIEALRPIIMGGYDKTVKEAQEALDKLLKGEE